MAAISRERAIRILERYGIRMVEERVVRSADAAARGAKGIGYPVVLKLISPDVVHKSDRGCVKANIMNEAELRAAYSHIVRNAGSARIDGMLLQRMVKDGIELIVGGRTDPQFGPLVMFGLGGIFVEVLKDVSIRVCPIAVGEAREMIGEIKGSPLLHGARGTIPVDTEKLARLLVNVSRMLSENPGICEFDLNPVIANARGYLAVDVRVISCPR